MNESEVTKRKGDFRSVNGKCVVNIDLISTISFSSPQFTRSSSSNSQSQLTSLSQQLSSKLGFLPHKAGESWLVVSSRSKHTNIRSKAWPKNKGSSTKTDTTSLRIASRMSNSKLHIQPQQQKIQWKFNSLCWMWLEFSPSRI